MKKRPRPKSRKKNKPGLLSYTASNAIVNTLLLIPESKPRTRAKRKKKLSRLKKQNNRATARTIDASGQKNATRLINNTVAKSKKIKNARRTKSKSKNRSDDNKSKENHKSKGAGGRKRDTGKSQAARKVVSKRVKNRVGGGCEVCGGADRWDALLICDKCQGEYHYSCLGLHRVPEGTWFCPRCSNHGACLGWVRLARSSQHLGGCFLSSFVLTLVLHKNTQRRP